MSKDELLKLAERWFILEKINGKPLFTGGEKAMIGFSRALAKEFIKSKTP